RDLASALFALSEQRTRRTWDRRFSWAAADGRQMIQHHLAGLRHLLAIADRTESEVPSPDASKRRWLGAEVDAALSPTLAKWRQRLDAVFGSLAWRDLDRGTPLTAEQDAALLALLAEVSSCGEEPLRRTLLAELGRRDPSLAYRAASHLWA